MYARGRTHDSRASLAAAMDLAHGGEGQPAGAVEPLKPQHNPSAPQISAQSAQVQGYIQHPAAIPMGMAHHVSRPQAIPMAGMSGQMPFYPPRCSMEVAPMPMQSFCGTLMNPEKGMMADNSDMCFLGQPALGASKIHLTDAGRLGMFKNNDAQTRPCAGITCSIYVLLQTVKPNPLPLPLTGCGCLSRSPLVFATGPSCAHLLCMPCFRSLSHSEGALRS